MGFGTLQRSDSLARLKKEALKRFHIWPKEPKPIIIDLSVQDRQEFELSKEYEVKCQLLVNSAESLSSPIIGGFPVGTHVTVLEIGTACLSGRRLKVTNKSGTVSGWVSSLAAGEPSLKKTKREILDFSRFRSNSRLRSRSLSSLSATKLRNNADLGSQPTKYLQIGAILEHEGKVIVRETESMSSPKILTVTGGCQMQILEYGKSSQNRMKVSVNGTTGWVTILDSKLHEPLYDMRRHTY